MLSPIPILLLPWIDEIQPAFPFVEDYCRGVDVASVVVVVDVDVEASYSYATLLVVPHRRQMSLSLSSNTWLNHNALPTA